MWVCDLCACIARILRMVAQMVAACGRTFFSATDDNIAQQKRWRWWRELAAHLAYQMRQCQFHLSNAIHQFDGNRGTARQRNVRHRARRFQLEIQLWCGKGLTVCITWHVCCPRPILCSIYVYVVCVAFEWGSLPPPRPSPTTTTTTSTTKTTLTTTTMTGTWIMWRRLSHQSHYGSLKNHEYTYIPHV